MRRRDVIAFLGGAAAWPLTAHAQAPQVWRIGILLPGSQSTHGPYLDRLRAGLTELGWVEGRTFTFDLRWAEGHLESLPALAGELVAGHVDLIVAGSSQATLAARQATATIPIVQAAGGDFVATGLATSLAHPGGNLTGLLNEAADLSAKQVQTIVSAFPDVRRIGVLIDPGTPTGAQRIPNLETAARALGVTVQLAPVSTPTELDAAFEALVRAGVNALVVLQDPIFVTHSGRVLELSTRTRLPAIYPYPSFPRDGGLMSYGVDLADNYHASARFVDRILKGARPGDIPVEQPTRFTLVVNLKAAKALGLDVPPTLLARADEVIE